MNDDAKPEGMLQKLRRRLRPGPSLRDDLPAALHGAAKACVHMDVKARLKTPIDQCRFVVLDTETTGLEAYAHDEIISIGLVELQGLEASGRQFQSLVNPGRSIPATSTVIHGLTDADVRDAPPLTDLLQDLLAFIGDSVLVGHHTAFDLRFLNKSLRPAIGCALQNPALDTMLMYLGHSGRVGHYSLEDVASYCHVALRQRHTALGDALITAEVFACLSRQLARPEDPVGRLFQQQPDSAAP